MFTKRGNIIRTNSSENITAAKFAHNIMTNCSCTSKGDPKLANYTQSVFDRDSNYMIWQSGTKFNFFINENRISQAIRSHMTHRQ